MNLEIDLNEFLSKEIAKKITGLENQIKNLKSEKTDYVNKVYDLENKIKESKISLNLLSKLRDEFSAITNTRNSSKQENQFDFIEKIMLYLFGVKKEYAGWYCVGDGGKLAPHLAINYYSNKKVLIDLLKMIKQNPENEISFIKSFKMPFDYDKKDVIEFIEYLPTNPGGYFGVSSYWVELSFAGKSNIPYDLIMANKHILDKDVFSLLLNTIKSKRNKYELLYELPKYNPNCTEKQIEAMGEMLIGEKKFESRSVISRFAKSNMQSFNNETLDHLFKFIEGSNNYRDLYYTNFPFEYQKRFLMDKNISYVLEQLKGSELKWTEEQKETFLKKFLNKN